MQHNFSANGEDHTTASRNTHSATCIMFAFVSVSHPDEIKDKMKQGKLRQHAIRSGIQRSKADRAKKEGVFVPVEVDGKSGQPIKRTPPKNATALTRTPSVSLMDPFDTLCGCPERLRTLMRHRAYLHIPPESVTVLTRCSIRETSRRAYLLRRGLR